MIPVDAGFVYPKTGLDADLRFDTTPSYVSSGSLHLPGGSTDDVEVDGLSWTSDGAWSFTCWVKSNDLTSGSNKKFFSVHASGNSHRIDFQASSDANLQIYTDVSSSQPTHTFTGAASQVQDGTWHHVALVAATSGSDSVYRIFIDGQQFGADSSACARPDISSADSGYIGNLYNGSGAALTGSLAHVGFWNAALSEAQVRSLMTATTYAEAVTKGGSTPAAYYLFEANANTSVGSDNGTLGGSAVIAGDRARLPNAFDLTNTRLDARSVSGRAIDLDGAGDFISLAHPADLDGFFNTGGTISMWINMTSTATFERLFDFSGGTYMYLQGSFGGYIFNKDFSTTDGNWTYNGNGGVSLGEWFHFCLSYNAASTSNNPDLYINGVLQTIDGETTPVGSAGADTTEKLFGINSDKASNPLDASLADIKLFTSTVTAAQALELYQNPEQILPTGIASSALKCWLPCSDYDIATADNSLNGLYAQDASGNGNHGALTNCGMIFSQPTIPQLGLRSSSSLVLLGGASSGDYLQSSDTSLSTATFTFSAWVCAFSSAGNYPSIISAHDGSSNDYDNGITIDFGSSSQTAVEYINIEGVGVSGATDLWSGSIAFGQWFHIAVTSTTSEYKLYINGSDTSCTTRSRSDTSANDLNIVRIGARYYSSSVQAASQFDGLITDVGLWNAALDADSVAAIHTAGRGADIRSDIGNYDQSSALQHLWRTDDPVTCSDLEGSDDMTVNGGPNVATVPEGTTAGSSVFGNLVSARPAFGVAGLPVKNVNDGEAYFKIGGVDFGTGNLTISTWFRMHRPFAANMSLISTYDGSAGIDYYAVSTTQLQAFVKGASAQGNTTAITDSDGYADRWYHVVLRREATSTWSVYLRGLGEAVKASTDLTGTDVGSLSAQTTLVFGSRNNATRYNSGASYAFPKVWVGEAITDGQCDALHEQGARFLRGL